MATFDVVPAFDPGEYRGVALRKPAAEVEDAAVDGDAGAAAPARRAVRAGRGPAARANDWATVDLARQRERSRAARRARDARERHHRPRRRGQPARVLRAAGGPRSRGAQGVHGALPRRAPGEGPRGPVGRVRRHAQGRQAAGRAGAGRRVREGPGRASTRWRRCGTGCGSDLEHEAAHEADRAVRGDLLADLAKRVPFARARGAHRAGTRPAGRGVRAAAGRAAGRSAQGRASTGTSSGRPSATRRRSR